MPKKNVFTKLLAIAGTVLVWFPLLMPLLAALGSVGGGRFNFDYLMPAELFPVALLGGVMLLWAAVRVRSRVKLIGIALGAAVLLLFASQGLAVLTGLASGATQPGGWQWVLVLAFLAGYAAALAVVGVGGILLLRELFQRRGAAEPYHDQEGVP